VGVGHGGGIVVLKRRLVELDALSLEHLANLLNVSVVKYGILRFDIPLS
jgi:hypothetical protein